LQNTNLGGEGKKIENKKVRRGRGADEPRQTPCVPCSTLLHQSQLALPREKLLQRSGRHWLRDTAWPRLEREQKRIVRSHMKLIAAYSSEITCLDRVIAHRGGEWDSVKLLRTVPGIGSFWGLLLAAELLPISRFASQAKFVSYTGLAPVTRSSGGHTHYGSVPKGANRWVRWALVSAVAKHVQCASESPVTQFYNRQKARLGWKKARVAAARKLGIVVYRMLQEQQPWRP
jgi:transposase